MGVWEAMFSSEEEGWADAVVGGISTVTNLAIELPSTLLVLISTALLLVWDYTCQGAQQVSDALGKIITTLSNFLNFPCLLWPFSTHFLFNRDFTL